MQQRRNASGSRRLQSRAARERWVRSSEQITGIDRSTTRTLTLSCTKTLLRSMGTLTGPPTPSGDSARAPSTNRAQLLSELRNFSVTPGSRIDWDEIASGLALIRQNQSVDYYGLAGPLTRNDEYSVDSALSIFRLYEIEGDPMVFGTNVTCSQPLSDSLNSRSR